MTIWRPVTHPRYRDYYQVSDDGQVMSFHARKGPRLLKPSPNSNGYPSVRLSVDKVQRTFPVYVLVAEAFLGHTKHPGDEIRHLNGRKDDCRVVNLAYGTRSANSRDAVRTGQNPNVRKTECPAGHDYAEHGWVSSKTGWRYCKACKAERRRANAKPRVYPSTCPQDHPFDEANTYYVGPNKSHRACRQCRRERDRARNARKRGQVSV